MPQISQIFKEFPTIDIGDFVLRQIDSSDINDYIEYLSNDDVNKYIPEECIPRTVVRAEEEVKYLRSLFNYKQSFYWVLARKSDDKVIGSCGYNYWNKDHMRCEISYDLAKSYHKQGIMSKAVKAVLDFGFEKMDLQRVEATITPTNLDSISLLKKLGFQQEGLLRQHKLLHGKFYDAIIMSVIKNEYKV